MNNIQIKARGFTFDALSDGPEEGLFEYGF